MSLPANWDQRLAELTSGCTEEEKGEGKTSTSLHESYSLTSSSLTSYLVPVYHRLIVTFGWKCMLDLKQQGKFTEEATAKFMRSMDEEEEVKLERQKADLLKGLDAFKSRVLEFGQPVDTWAQELTKQSGLTV